MELPENQLRYIFEKHRIEYIKKLGSGGFGSVYLGNSISQEFLPLAVKCITRKQLAKKPSLEKYLSQEINSMYSLKHPNIVKLLKTFVGNCCLM
jgi:serine/threonine protein kinase